MACTCPTYAVKAAASTTTISVNRTVDTRSRKGPSDAEARRRVFVCSRSVQLGRAVPCRCQLFSEDGEDGMMVEKMRFRRRMCRNSYRGKPRRETQQAQVVAGVLYGIKCCGIKCYGIIGPASTFDWRSAMRSRALRARAFSSISASEAVWGEASTGAKGATSVPYRSRFGVPSKLP